MTDFLYLLIILGSLQGIIVGALFFLQRRPSYADRLLACIIWFTALPGIHLYLHYKAVFASEGATAILHAIIPWVTVTAIGPLILFYTRSVIHPGFRIRIKHIGWFLPVIIDVLPKAVELLHLSGITGTTTGEVAAFIDSYNKYADIPRWLIMAVSIIVAGREFKRYRASAPSPGMQTSSLPAVQGAGCSATRWLSQFLNVFRHFLLIWLLFLIPYVLPAGDELLAAAGWFPVYIPMAIMIYWLGIRGYIGTRASAAAGMPKPPPKMIVNEMEMKVIADQLTALLREKKLYLDPAFDLAALAGISQIPSRYISYTLNQHLGKTFNQFLNEFRVEEFKARVSSLRELSIAGLAAACGFPSLATFQRVFKQVTGQSPTQYLRQNSSAGLLKS